MERSLKLLLATLNVLALALTNGCFALALGGRC
jgi:hypothetical protein